MSLGSRLRVARELVRGTQTSFAKVASVSQPTWARMERDAAPVEDDILRTVAEHTGLPIEFFVQPGELAPIGEHGSSQYREHSRLTLAERKRAHAAASIGWDAIQKCAAASGVGLPSLRIPSPEAVTGLEIEEASQATRHALDLGPDGPIGHLTRRLERAGVRIIPIPVTYEQPKIERGIDAFSDWCGHHALIAISSDAPGDRQRMTLAHELAHLVMHVRGGDDKALEREATEFGAALLMPKDSFLDTLPEHRITVTDLAALKRHWKTSMASIVMRAAKLGAIGSDEKTRLFRVLSARGWRRREPVEIPREHTALLASLAERAYGTTNPRDLSKILNLNAMLTAGLVDRGPEGMGEEAQVVALRDPSTRRARASD